MTIISGQNDNLRYFCLTIPKTTEECGGGGNLGGKLSSMIKRKNSKF